MKLPPEFYQRSNVVRIARDLLGKALYTNVNDMLTGGLIVETEAYSWKERGCHAYRKNKTNRNAIMFDEGGFSYVYLCYGMHNLFNVVTNLKDIPEAVLIRALEPLEGETTMMERRNGITKRAHLTSGPGKLTKAMGIDRKLNGKSLLKNEIWIEDIGCKIASKQIVAGPRIGIDYAGEDALLPWRFFLKDNPWVSKLPAVGTSF